MKYHKASSEPGGLKYEQMTARKKKVKKVEIQNLEDSIQESPDPAVVEEKQDESPSVVTGESAPEAEASCNDLSAKLAEMTDNWQRERASFQNYKRRIEDEKKNIRKYAAFDLVYDLLRIIDYFESSINFSENLPPEAQNVILGVEYTLKELKGILSAHGVSPIIVKPGDDFDSSTMVASERLISADTKPGTVVEVQREGWMYNDRVLRSPQVVVAVSPDEPEAL